MLVKIVFLLFGLISSKCCFSSHMPTTGVYLQIDRLAKDPDLLDKQAEVLDPYKDFFNQVDPVFGTPLAHAARRTDLSTIMLP